MNSLPASSFKADSGKGTIRRHFIVWKMWPKDHEAGFQSFFSVFTHMSPLGVATLGWKILVKKYPFGGFAGKSLSKISLHLKIPPWKGVSTGPTISAWISRTSPSTFWWKMTPSGHFFTNSACYLARTFIIFGSIFTCCIFINFCFLKLFIEIRLWWI